MSDVPLGKLIEGEAQRDAVHVAIAPVVAGERLSPGCHIGFISADRQTVGRCNCPIGIVDPYLPSAFVDKGERFYLCLYPQTIKSIRHDWTHPSFEASELQNAAALESQRAESIAWLTNFAESVCEMPYDDLIAAAIAWIDHGEWHTFQGFDTPDECYSDRKTLWRHIAVVTGRFVKDDDDHMFSCSC